MLLQTSRELSAITELLFKYIVRIEKKDGQADDDRYFCGRL